MIQGFVRLAVIGLAIVGTAGLAGANVAQAALLTWNFGGGSSSLSGPFGNTRTFLASDGTTAVTATAWGRTVGTSNTQFESAYIGHYSSGLGVTNRDEGTGGNASHTMDNVTQLDVIAFLFSSVIEPTSAFLAAFSASGVTGDPDSDISVWIGNAAGPVNLTGLTIADLDSTYGPRLDNTGPMGSTRTANFGNGSTGNLLLMSAQVSELLNGTGEDLIKVTKLSGKTVEVPEPTSLMIFAMGLGAFGLMLGRRRRSGAALA